MRYLTLSLITLTILLGAILLTFVAMEAHSFAVVNGTVTHVHSAGMCQSTHYGWDQTSNHVQTFTRCEFDSP